jgi:phage terminase small subunit
MAEANTAKQGRRGISAKAALSPKQALFCREYLVDLNATQAAERAGYSAATARAQGARLLTKVDIAAEVERLGAEREKRTEITADVVLRELLAIARVDIAEAFTDAGTLRPIHEMPEAVRRAIAGIDVYEEYTGRGEERENIGQTKKVRFSDKIRALELLGKHLRLFVDSVELTGKNGGAIQSTGTTLSPEQIAQVEKIAARRAAVEASQKS